MANVRQLRTAQPTTTTMTMMNAPSFCTLRLFLTAICLVLSVQGFVHPTTTSRQQHVVLHDMKRPILDQIASTLFQLETKRVQESSEIDDKGRVGEPMAWSESSSWANRLSEIMAKQGYGFKQFVADIVAGEYDETTVNAQMDDLIESNTVAMFSFTTCPFCRRAKDALEERGIPYQALELDELEGNLGNEIRAQLGRRTGRTSVPSIFVQGNFIGGCNDGPGLLPLLESGELDTMIQKS